MTASMCYLKKTISSSRFSSAQKRIYDSLIFFIEEIYQLACWNRDVILLEQMGILEFIFRQLNFCQLCFFVFFLSIPLKILILNTVYTFFCLPKIQYMFFYIPWL